MNKNILIIFQIQFFLILLILYFLKVDIDILKYYFIFIYIEVFILSLKKKFLNIYQIFLGMLFFFNFARIFQDVFFNYQLELKTLYIRGYLKEQTIRELLFFFGTFLIASSIAFLNNIKDPRIKIKNKSKGNSKILIIIYFIFLFLSCSNFIKIIIFVKKNGYLSLFNGEINEVEIIRGVISISQAIFIVLLYNHKTKKEFYIYVLSLLTFLFVPKLLTGQRGATLTLIVYLIYIYNKKYKIKNKRNIFLGVGLLFCIIKWAEAFRYSKEISLNIKKIFEGINMVLYEQSVSMLISGYILEYKEDLIINHKYPYIFSYIIDFFKGFKNYQSIERIYNGNYLGDQLTYYISKAHYLKGAGTGTAIIAEIIDLSYLNILFFIIISYIFIDISLKIEKNQKKNIFIFTISYFYLQSFIFSPRDSVIKIIPSLFIFIPLVYIIYKFNNIVLETKNKNKG